LVVESFSLKAFQRRGSATVRPRPLAALLALYALVGSTAHNLAAAEPLGTASSADVSEIVATLRSARHITNAVLTYNGDWLLYALTEPASGQASIGATTIVLRSTHTSVEKRYDAIAEPFAHPFAVSSSGRWIAFEDRAGGITAVELSTGNQIRQPDAHHFSLEGSSPNEWLLTWSGVDPARDIVITHLGDGSRSNVPGVTQFSVSPDGRYLAWAGADTLFLRDLTSPMDRELRGIPPGGFGEIRWSPNSTAFALMVRANDEARILAVENVRRGPAHVSEIYSHTPRFAAGLAVDGSAPVQWRTDGAGFFFYMRHVAHPATDRAVASNLVIWHSADTELPMQRQADSAPAFLSYFSLAHKRLAQLADDLVPSAIPHGQGRFVLGYSPATGRPTGPEGYTHQYRDYYLIDLVSGHRTLILENLRVETYRVNTLSIQPMLSPDGQFVLYEKDGNYFAYHVQTGANHNLTGNLGNHFYYDDNGPNNLHLHDHDGPGLVTVFQGWSADGRSALVSDYRDVWALGLDGGAARKLTEAGPDRSVVFTRLAPGGLMPGADDIDHRVILNDSVVDLRSDVFFSARDLRSARTGIASLRSGAIHVLNWQDADMRYFLSSEGATLVALRSTATDWPDYFSIDLEGRPAVRLSDANPSVRLHALPQHRLLWFTTRTGITLPATLYLPFGARIGGRFPTIVSIYEEMTDGPHELIEPSRGDIFTWLSHGYAVLIPSIRPRLNHGGGAALESVTAAVRAAVSTGVVDGDRLGLTGYSYGGYETNYIIAHTNMFSAAVSRSGISDLISSYGSIHGRMPNALVSENSQPYLPSPWWEDWGAYVSNSPLFAAQNIQTPLLLIHGDQDSAVSFAQPLELFNALRRMGNKSVVLLEYVGANHSLENADPDMSERILEFFDHFLRGSPSPRWWSDGRSYPQGTAPAATDVAIGTHQ
jgi:dipeptidyl aminopeptidase/acylaminoacyl peptidase